MDSNNNQNKVKTIEEIALKSLHKSRYNKTMLKENSSLKTIKLIGGKRK